MVKRLHAWSVNEAQKRFHPVSNALGFSLALLFH